MKTFFYSLTVFLLFSCKKEKSFADKIIFHDSHHEKLNYQQFNEGIDEAGTCIIYVGKDTSTIELKYYMGMMDPPTPPLGFVPDSSYRKREQMLTGFFYHHFNRIKSSENLSHLTLYLDKI